jgi:hypothetical protein
MYLSSSYPQYVVDKRELGSFARPSKGVQGRSTRANKYNLQEMRDKEGVQGDDDSLSRCNL